MARFATFKIPGELRNITLNLERVNWFAQNQGFADRTSLHFADDYVTVEASEERIRELIEAEFGQVLDGTPSDG